MTSPDIHYPCIVPEIRFASTSLNPHYRKVRQIFSIFENSPSGIIFRNFRKFWEKVEEGYFFSRFRLYNMIVRNKCEGPVSTSGSLADGAYFTKVTCIV